MKQKEALVSVLPISCIVLILALTPILDLTLREALIFCGCSIGLIIGIGLFNLGADISMTPMGHHIGNELIKTRRISLLLPIVFVLGLLITVAEPDLSVLASQVAETMNGTTLIFSIGVGVAICLTLGVIKILTHSDLSKMLFFAYMAIFALTAILAETGRNAFIPLSFDSGGVTTGPVTVPFIMALGIGIASAVGGNRPEENSFGLISLSSAGPLLAIMILALFSKGSISYALPDYSIAENFGSALISVILETCADVAKALLLIFAFFIVLKLTVLKIPHSKLMRIFVGIIYTFVGLVIFLSSVSLGFMPIGYKIGTSIASLPAWAVVVFGTVIGFVVVLAEPAVHVLTSQVSEVTGGTVSRKSMLLALSLGVGISIGLSCLRIVLGFSILWYLVPGYLISLVLSFFVPGIYTSIAFDSGGVASGPLTSSFILPMAIGVCAVTQGADSVLGLAFGVVAMVAMTPLITIQSLGFRAIVAAKVRRSITMKRILDADDEQIICFTVKGGQNAE